MLKNNIKKKHGLRSRKVRHWPQPWLTITFNINNRGLGDAAPQVGQWHAGQLGGGAHAEEVLEDQAGAHQGHGQEGGRVRGGLGRRPGRQAGGERLPLLVWELG